MFHTTKSPPSSTAYPKRLGFTLIELLIAIGIVTLLVGILLPVLGSSRRAAKNILCMNNLRQFAIADISYVVDYDRLPPIDTFLPSSIQVRRLQQIADYYGQTVPAGPATAWPKRIDQPAWVSCPFAVESGEAEGITLGGGLYTGYVYVGGIESSAMVQNGMAAVSQPGHAAPAGNDQRGVLWADILTEYLTAQPRRYEFFHSVIKNEHPNFMFYAEELEGINRAWSDGSVQWTPGQDLDLSGPGSQDLQLKHAIGNFYY